MRLVMCDGNRLLCEALAVALAKHGHEVLAITATATEGIAAAAAHQPDAFLLDLRLPGGRSGLDVVREVRRHHPRTKILVLSGLAGPAAWREAEEAGAAGFVRKDQNVAQIADALNVIAAGGTVFGPMPHQPGPRAAVTRRQHPIGLTVLTPREAEVLRRIIAGQTTGQMAREMCIATSTLRSHVKNVLAKLGAHSRLQAAALAAREDLLRNHWVA
jgi:two-component system nitrate/nitrite response regulator NarL